jgi:hypothetical protein
LIDHFFVEYRNQDGKHSRKQANDDTGGKLQVRVVNNGNAGYGK